MFHARDQEVFHAFTDVPVNVTGTSLSYASVSIVPLSGNVKDFDFDLSIKTDNMGVSSKNLGYQGEGTLNGHKFTFSGPISEFEMKYAMGQKYNHYLKYNAWVFEEYTTTLKMNEGDLKVEGADLSASVRSEVLSSVQ